MLDTVDFDQRRQLIEGVPCRVRIPADWTHLVEDEGCAPARVADFRAGMRYRVCRRAVVEVRGGLPAFERTKGYFGAIVQDFSRHGMGILYHEQLFPEERLRILMPSMSLEARVVRCRRCGPDCYALGLSLDREFGLRELLA